jgi:predicted nucleic acid-binding protein
VPRNDSVVYLDSSAIVKLIIRERETESLRSFLQPHRNVVSSILAEVEVMRVSRFYGPATERRAQLILGSLSTIALSRDVAKVAGRLSPKELRSLDAIHLATALKLGDSLFALVTYDRRMASAAELLGIAVASPVQE